MASKLRIYFNKCLCFFLSNIFCLCVCSAVHERTITWCAWSVTVLGWDTRRLHGTTQSFHDQEDPHLSDMRQSVSERDIPDTTYQDSHRGETLQVWCVWQRLQTETTSQISYKSHGTSLAQSTINWHKHGQNCGNFAQGKVIRLGSKQLILCWAASTHLLKLLKIKLKHF